MELLTALQLVAEDPNIDRSGGVYLDDMKEWFSSYSNHPAVLHYKSINEFFCFDAPVSSMLFTRFDDKLELISEPADYFYQRADGKENWMAFYNGLRDFAHDTNFKEFYRAHQGYYNEVIDKVKAIKANCDPVGELERYINMSSDKYTFIYSPLQTCGYGGHNLPNNIGVYCTIGFDCEKQDDRAEIGLRIYLWHEFAHYYINPMLDNYLDKNPDIYEALIKKLVIDEDKYPFANYYEYFVRAITYKLNAIYYGQKEADGILNWEESDGFIYIRNFIQALSKFEPARDSTQISLKDYFPSLINDVIHS
jgi:hypothetical protein